MAVTIDIFYEAGVYTRNGTVDLTNANIKLALLTKDYTPNLDTHDVWADVSANEVATGNGYTTGGAAVTGLSVTRSGSVVTWDAADVQFVALTKTFKYGILYIDATVNSVEKPLIALIDFDDTTTTAEITVADSVYNIQWHTDGIWQGGPTTDICP
jgi:ABC-type lipopolysaccharide export system ATPase subunit